VTRGGRDAAAVDDRDESSQEGEIREHGHAQIA
jgi:hypothetical protein